jgi:glycosyltransferase involved in cell wall biosynthesis
MLFVDRYAPEPDKDAGSRTMDDFIRSFQAMGWIVKFWPQNLNYNRVYMSALQQMGVETLYGPYETSMADWLARNGGDIDAVFISRPEIAAEFLTNIRKATAAPVLFYGHDLHFARRRLEAKITGKPEFERLAAADEAAERQIWRNVDVVLYPTQEEADEVVRLEPHVTALAAPAYCFDHVAERPAPPTGQSILFVAGFDHTPNVDAATWFATDILPLVRRIHPEAKLSLVGSGARPRVAHLASEGVEVVGWVSHEELQARYDAARLAVMPLRFGAGIKLKVVEALAAGLPLVTSTIGAQGLAGLETVSGVEDDAAGFAAAVARLLAASEAEWLAVSRRQARFIADKFRREGQIAALRGALEAAGAKRGG